MEAHNRYRIPENCRLQGFGNVPGVQGRSCIRQTKIPERDQRRRSRRKRGAVVTEAHWGTLAGGRF